MKRKDKYLVNSLWLQNICLLGIELAPWFCKVHVVVDTGNKSRATKP